MNETMLKNAFPLPSPSGFVAFDGGGSPAADAYRVTGKGPSIVQPAVESVEPAAVEQGMPQSAVWEPAIGRRARWVEGGVIVAMCGYFLFGFFNVVRG